MKDINWKLRFKNPATILGLISAFLLLANQVAVLFGVEISEALGEQIMQIAETVLGIMVVLGVVVDPTTEGLKDSERALDYKELGK